MNRKEELLDKVLKSRGFIEDFHEVLAEKDPDLLEIWSKVWEHVLGGSSLDKKTISLIRLAVVAAINNQTAVNHSMDQAIEAGADAGEILDSLEVAFVFTGVPTLVNSLSTYRKKFKL